MAKKLRFAVLVRVSTEKQEEQGESLRKQRTDVTNNVSQLGGEIVEWYGGHEHATPGYETKEVDRLLADAQKKNRRFDFVMVHHADRWSRDNVKSSTGLDTLLEAGIQYFYVLGDKHDLYDPTDRLRLAFHAVIGQYFAHNQTKKSLEAKIHRAQRGIPSVGKRPYGRVYVKGENGEKGKWSIDKEKEALVKDAARRYLKGESLSAIAQEYGVNHSALHRTLMHRCGSDWELEFKSKKLNIHEKVTITIPPLLDAKTIKDLRRKAAANKTYTHGSIKNHYLLGRMIFCGHCGYAMFGQTNRNGAAYYRHSRQQQSRKKCNCGTCWIRTEVIEDNVLRLLFDTFGNKIAIQKAIDAATPDLEERKELEAQRTRLMEAKDKQTAGRKRLLKMIDNGLISEEEGNAQIAESNKRGADIDAKLRTIDAKTADGPSADAKREVAEKVAEQFKPLSNTKRFALANRPFGKMTGEQKRELVHTVFGDKLLDGKRAGVYIKWHSGEKPKRNGWRDPDLQKTWSFSVRGVLVNEQGRSPDFYDESKDNQDVGNAQYLDTSKLSKEEA